MIFKSYVVESNFEILKNNLILFYGENEGLLSEFKRLINSKNRKSEKIRFSQEEILTDNLSFISYVKNISLFDNNRVFIIDNASDKLLPIIENLLIDEKNKIFLFSNLLEKKSKLRSFFEKNSNTDIIPCYNDSYLTLKKLLLDKLKDYSGLTPVAINMVLDCCNNNRSKLYNEIDKIISYFEKKTINIDQLTKLLNLSEIDDFNLIKDSAFLGDKLNTNKLLASTNIDNEKSIFYLASINQRIQNLNKVIDKKISIENAVNNLKPPLFWRDKPVFLNQAKLWNKNKLKDVTEITFNIEINIKSNSVLNKQLIIKKLLINICDLANAA